MSELKPCPVCGKAVRLFRNAGRAYYVICNACGYNTPSFPSEESCLEWYSGEPKRDIRECPKCGHKAEHRTTNPYKDPEGKMFYVIQCLGCGYVEGKYAVRADAVAAWNRRGDNAS